MRGPNNRDRKIRVRDQPLLDRPFFPGIFREGIPFRTVFRDGQLPVGLGINRGRADKDVLTNLASKHRIIRFDIRQIVAEEINHNIRRHTCQHRLITPVPRHCPILRRDGSMPARKNANVMSLLVQQSRAVSRNVPGAANQ